MNLSKYRAGEGQGSLYSAVPWGSQTVGHDWVTEQQRTELKPRTPPSSWLLLSNSLWCYLTVNYTSRSKIKYTL